VSLVALLLTFVVGVAEAQPVAPAPDARSILLQARGAASSIAQAHTRARALRAIAWTQHRAGDRVEALQTLEQATGAALQIEDRNSRLDAVADVLFLQIHMGDAAGARTRVSTLFVGVASPLPWLLVEAGQPAAARALMNGLEPQRRPELLAAMAVAQAAAGNRPASAATMREAIDLATALIQDWRRSSALVAVIRASAELRDVAGARRLAQQVSDRGWQAAAWEQVAVAQARSGDVAGARQTVGAIADSERRNLALIGIGQAQAKAGDVQGALATAALASGHARARILREAAKAQAAAGDVVRARAIAAVISEEGESSAALRAIARAQLGRGDVTAAQATVALLPPLAQTYVLGEVAVAQVKAGDVAGGLATARGAPTTEYRWMALRDVAIAQAAAGDLAAARQTAASIGDASVEYQDTAEALRGISAIQAKRGDVKGAVAAALAQTATAPKAFGLLGAAQGLLDGAGLGRAEPVRRDWNRDRDDGVDD
jgi:hypothetical protein